jgi:ubiquinone/menaquinone biosynthesis C-methylase UbiE
MVVADANSPLDSARRAVGLYSEHVLPRWMNVGCGMKSVEPLRRRVCAGLAGDVLEIGFGSGHNVPFYPAAVAQVDAVEPSDVGWRLAGKRLAATRGPVRRSGLDGQSLPFADASHDAALSTWTLCTIPDVAAALRDVRRVLKPGGTLHFLEHGLAPDSRCAAGSGASSRYRSGSSAAVISPGRWSSC